MREEEGWGGDERGKRGSSVDSVCVCVWVCGIEERKLITQVMREARESC